MNRQLPAHALSPCFCMHPGVSIRKAPGHRQQPSDMYLDLWLAHQTRGNHTNVTVSRQDRWPAASMLVGWPPLTFLLVIVMYELGGTLRTPGVMFCSSQFLFCSSTSKTGFRVLSARNSTIDEDTFVTRRIPGWPCSHHLKSISDVVAWATASGKRSLSGTPHLVRSPSPLLS
jgi:hypothetical protein